MPSEVRYSLFPPPDDVLRNHSLKRLTAPPAPAPARPKTPSGSYVRRQPSMKTIREEDRRDPSPPPPPSVVITNAEEKKPSPSGTGLGRSVSMSMAEKMRSTTSGEVRRPADLDLRPKKSQDLERSRGRQVKTAAPPFTDIAMPDSATLPPPLQSNSPVSKHKSSSPVSANSETPSLPPPDKPLPRAPGATSAPKAFAPALRTSSPAPSKPPSVVATRPKTPSPATTKPSISPATQKTQEPISVVDFAMRKHTRTGTGDSASTAATTAYRPSPVSAREELASPGDMFSPITPGSEVSAVSYPLVPKLASSPIAVQTSPPRRSSSRASAATAQSARWHIERDTASVTGSTRAGLPPPPPPSQIHSLRRMPSATTSRPGTAMTERTEASPPGTSQYTSMFPIWNPALPLSQQDDRPRRGLPSETSHRPSIDADVTINGSPVARTDAASPARLTEANLRALDGRSDNRAPKHPATGAANPSGPTDAQAAVAALKQQHPRTRSDDLASPLDQQKQHLPPRTTSISHPTADAPPTFAPPPTAGAARRFGRRTPGTSATAALPTMLDSASEPSSKKTRGPRTKVVLAKRPKRTDKITKTSTEGENTTKWTSTTRAVTRLDGTGKEDGGVLATTTMTTTTTAMSSANVSPVHGHAKGMASLDWPVEAARSSHRKQSSGSAARSKSASARPSHDASASVQRSRWAAAAESDGEEQETEPGAQHGVTVALGAVAFVVGVGVEVVGGAMGGFRRRGRRGSSNGKAGKGEGKTVGGTPAISSRTSVDVR